MLLIIGFDVDDPESWIVRDLHRSGTPPARQDPAVYWPASMWPEVEQLVRFADARERLGLPTLENARWH